MWKQKQVDFRESPFLVGIADKVGSGFQKTGRIKKEENFITEKINLFNVIVNVFIISFLISQPFSKDKKMQKQNLEKLYPSFLKVGNSFGVVNNRKRFLNM